MTRVSLVFGLMFAAVSAAVPAQQVVVQQAQAQPACENLKSIAPAGVTIMAAVSVPAGPFVLPSPQGRTIQAPAFCRLTGVIGQEIRFELWMPAHWNRKFLGVGNGGFAGTISYNQMAGPLQRGYATGSTNTGHAGGGNEASWAQGHLERVVNFANRSIHLMTDADKAIIQAFYGTRPQHSYFSGCSGGGDQALMEAQRYPGDYEGIIAGDPANNWTRHYYGGHLWILRAIDGDGYIPAAKVPVIADAVNAACDALDGVRDGLLTDPRRCHFDPATLLCKNGDGPHCLTGAQVEAVRKIYTGLRTSEGEQIYPGLVPGGESGPGGWTNWITGTKPGSGGHIGLGLPFFRYMVFDDPNWDLHSFRFEAPKGVESDVDITDAKLGPIFNAIDPNLNPFKARGGKLIQYHGWSDPDITPLNSINYYEDVVRVMAHNGNHGLRDTREFYRLFMVPGMQHCTGGPGPNVFDMVSPLEHWVEQGEAPDKVVALHVANGNVDRTRPLCAYPMEAHWKGSGSTDTAENFVCALPPRP